MHRRQLDMSSARWTRVPATRRCSSRSEPRVFIGPTTGWRRIPPGPPGDQEYAPTPDDDPLGASLAVERRDQVRAKASAQLLGNHGENAAERARLCELEEGVSAVVTAHGLRDVELDELEPTLEHERHEL